MVSTVPTRLPLSCSDIGEEGTDSVVPGRQVLTSAHRVPQCSQMVVGDHHDIAEVVGESESGRIPVLGRGEEGAGEEDEAVRVLMVATVGRGDEVLEASAERSDRVDAGELAAVVTGDGESELEAPRVLEPGMSRRRA